MKKTVFVLTVIASILFAGCKKSNAAESVSEAISENEKETQSDQEEYFPVAEKEKPEEELNYEIPKDEAEYFSVNSPEGIKVRWEPGLDSMKILGLADKTVVKLLEKGPEETIDGITACWMKIEVPPEIAEKENKVYGWVFGGYMEKCEVDSPSSDYFNYFLFEQTGLASIGSYIKPKKYTDLTMYSAASEKSTEISLFKEGDLGVIIRGYPDVDDGECCWFYILNQTNGKRGWVTSKTSFYSTADGSKISDSKKIYPRKNADVFVDKFKYEATLGYMSRIVLCSDNIHYIARTNDSKNLTVFDRNGDGKKQVCLSSYLGGYNSRDSNAICYSARSNSVFFGWGKSLYRYSVTDDNVFPVFEIDTSVPEALSSSLSINEIYVSKDERYFYMVAEFETGRRYISRMVAYDSTTKKQKILDVVTRDCDSDHYFDYGNVDFDEKGNAIYAITNSRWTSSNHIVENALVTVSAGSKNWPEPVVHMFPQASFSDKTYYIPGSDKVLCCDSRFCIYGIDEKEKESDVQFKESYRFAEASLYDSMSGYGNYQMNEDKSICAVMSGTINKYISFYSMKTFNLLFSLKLDGGADSFWWNGKMLLVKNNPDRDKYTYSTYDITIKEKENQISDNEPLSEAVVGLCAKTFRGKEYGEMGYKFSFSPNGLYICYNFYAMSESEEMEKSVIGAYEVTGKNKVRLYPYYSTFKPFYPYCVYQDEAHDFSRYHLLPNQKGKELTINQKYPMHNRFGEIYLIDEEGESIGSTYDWDIGYGAYGVHYEKAASAYQVCEK